ncbi:TetR/AcrR family transcriptional regulator [Acetobacterium wieringae]|uniref:Biofilm operon icaADBC HTH-type negative transcriptional regulator IcaR n=1 Tax=Acetobacterium wieringae TaxID=52694 RepID=A0A1F2PIR7_9FIRM|nr:TetR/AcrR family transcriptional regulator [Acetobacterium wieringae]OFV70834.1 biofilm operon icaADBC HTH-type negative transcriptional regulator IcaR [Acetobacterium wieringae]
MTKRNTREIILEEALNLFAVKGYQSVTVKEIAHAVGIKDSSLYKHFDSKQAIYDTLLEWMNQKFEETVTFYRLPQGEIESVAREYGRNDLIWLKKACEAVFLFFLKDPQAAKFRRMLTIEQYKSDNAAKTLNSWFFNDAIRFQTDLFKEMIKQGSFRDGPPQIIALQFYGPFYTLLCQYDQLPEKEAEALELLMAHIEQFAAIYQIRNEEC